MLKLVLFGSPQILLNDAPLALTSLKARALLFYLVTTRQPAPRPTLAGLLWSDAREADALNRLRVTLTTLRTALPNALRADRQTVAFNFDCAFTADVIEFEDWRAAREPVFARVRAAVELYRGEFLQDLTLRDAPLFEEWLTLERERLRQRALEALRQLTAHYAARNEFADGIAIVQRWLALEPLSEPAHRALMDLYARAGDRAAALKQYDACRDLLAQELGVSPSAETTALAEKIARTVTPSAPPLPFAHNLPARTASFVGRTTELEQIVRLLRQPDCRLVTLCGLGGMGKTRLALEAARAFDASDFEGVFFIPLAALTTPDLLVPTIAQTLGVSLAGARAPLATLIEFLRAKKWLLVLDNFEHLATHAGVLVEILHGAPNVKMLITAREPLHLYEEWIVQLAGLDEASAMELFTQRAQRVHLGFTLAAERAAAAEICRLVEGMPLAIEMAAARVREMACATIAQEIRRGLDALVAPYQNVPARQRSVRAVFEYTWNLLSDGERDALARLTIFRGGWTLETARAAARVDARALSALVQRSLVRHDPNGRYDLHPLVCEFAAEKLSDADVWRDEHARWFAQWLGEKTDALYVVRESGLLKQVDAEIENVRAAWERVVARKMGAALDAMLPALALYYEARDGHLEGARVFAHAAEQFADEPLRVARLNARRAKMGLRLGLFAEARELADASLPVLREHDDRNEVAALLNTLGSIERNLSHLDHARALLEEACVHFQALGDARGLAAAWNNLGTLAYVRGEYADAVHAFERALAALERLGDRVQTCLARCNLGVMRVYLGEYDAAERDTQIGLTLARELGLRRNEALALANLGFLALKRREFVCARESFTQSRAIETEMGHRSNQISTLLGLGHSAAGLGETSTALELYERAAQLAQEINDRRNRALALAHRGLVKTQLAQDAEAAADLRAALSLALNIQALPVALRALAGLAGVYARAGDTACARTMLRVALAQPQADSEVRDTVESVARAQCWSLGELARAPNGNGALPTFEEIVTFVQQDPPSL